MFVINLLGIHPVPAFGGGELVHRTRAPCELGALRKFWDAKALVAGPGGGQEGHGPPQNCLITLFLEYFNGIK